jgi:hypothetical protein
MSKKAPHVLVKGDHVDFVRHGDARIFDAPPNYVLLHDTDGSYFRRCDAIICGYAFQSDNEVEPTEASLRTARKYYGEGFELENGWLAHPSGPWQRLMQLDAIRYFRAGEHEDYYRHVFNREIIRYEQPVWLFEQPRTRTSRIAYKVALPDGCVWNERGFVKP